MKKLVTDAPADNGEMMLNLIFVKDKEVWVRYGSEAGEDCTLVEFCRRLCAACGTCSYEEAPYQTGDDLDVIGDILMDCSSDGCPVGTMYFAMIQAAELRERGMSADPDGACAGESAGALQGGLREIDK